MKTIQKIIMFSFMLAIIFLSSVKVHADEVTEEEQTTEDTTGQNVLYAEVGLMAVGGAGALVIAHNSKKEKNVPIEEVNSDIPENEK